eukprot:15384462-Alexandrium_andersonii.AAC.1
MPAGLADAFRFQCTAVTRAKASFSLTRPLPTHDFGARPSSKTVRWRRGVSRNRTPGEKTH